MARNEIIMAGNSCRHLACMPGRVCPLFTEFALSNCETIAFKTEARKGFEFLYGMTLDLTGSVSTGRAISCVLYELERKTWRREAASVLDSSLLHLHRQLRIKTEANTGGHQGKLFAPSLFSQLVS
ncbi:hypothetical protein RRG08_034786 [Elysia crispata]|uniref:Uncharacterized protein n=1 Tax=Elysia crispata TaxID=231223 RepID=A0AAE1CVV5_9GAST|nr:hypothetical protein RRG08_034786 [Elysia crispata]